jgi:hypothetical protein
VFLLKVGRQQSQDDIISDWSEKMFEGPGKAFLIESFILNVMTGSAHPRGSAALKADIIILRSPADHTVIFIKRDGKKRYLLITADHRSISFKSIDETSIYGIVFVLKMKYL